MGRPSKIKKQEKRKRQKKKKDGVSKSKFSVPVESCTDSITLLQHASTIPLRETNIPSSALLFSDLPQAKTDDPATSLFSAPLAHPIVNSRFSEIDDTCNEGQTVNTAYYVGDADIDLVEMDVYDAYREDDGKLPSNTYLLKCNKKLRWKINHANIMIRKLERQNLKEKLENENSKKKSESFMKQLLLDAREQDIWCVRQWVPQMQLKK